MATSPVSEAFRQRSGQTKRERSRSALLTAAGEVFTERGWLGARIEDIARAAGVSVATAYNHFPGGKQELIGVVYAPLVAPLLEAATADIAAQRDPWEAVIRHVTEMAALARQHHRLTAPLLAAVHEQTIQVGPPTDPRDVRMLVPFPMPLIQLVSDGQARGAFRPHPPGAEVGAYHSNGLLLRVLTRPKESAQDTAGLVLSQLLPGLALA